jgi:hypothetical protein
VERCSSRSGSSRHTTPPTRSVTSPIHGFAWRWQSCSARRCSDRSLQSGEAGEPPTRPSPSDSLVPILLRALPPLGRNPQTQRRDPHYPITVLGLVVYGVLTAGPSSCSTISSAAESAGTDVSASSLTRPGPPGGLDMATKGEAPCRPPAARWAVTRLSAGPRAGISCRCGSRWASVAASSGKSARTEAAPSGPGCWGSPVRTVAFVHLVTVDVASSVVQAAPGFGRRGPNAGGVLHGEAGCIGDLSGRGSR